MERQTEVDMRRPAQGRPAISVLSSFIRTVTVGSGISPDLLTPTQVLDLQPGARGLPESDRDTAGGEFHPALRISADSVKKKSAGCQPKTHR